MWLFTSGVFRFEILGFEQVQGDFYKGICRVVEIGEFDAEARHSLDARCWWFSPQRARKYSANSYCIIALNCLPVDRR